MANDKISNMTAAVVGDLGATTSGLECTVDLGGAPTTKQVPLGVLADWLEASQLAALIVTNSVVSATAIATPGAFGATRGAFLAWTVSGAALMGFGTTNDVALMNRAGTVCLGVGPNTTVVNIPGTLTVTGAATFDGGANGVVLQNTVAGASQRANFIVAGTDAASAGVSWLAGINPWGTDGGFELGVSSAAFRLTPAGAASFSGTLTVTGAAAFNAASDTFTGTAAGKLVSILNPSPAGD